jgi:hypothetical protein
MHRTSNAFSVLQAIAVIGGLAVLLWSIGLPSLRFAEAATVSFFSDTISDSTPSASANHTIVFNTPSGLSASEAIVLTFQAGIGIGTLSFEDIDLAVNGVDEALAATPSGANWGVSTSSNTITITSGTSTIGTTATVTIEIGTTGTYQLSNPGVTGSYEVSVDVGASDSGQTEIVIVDSVTVSATVDTIFNFSVGGVAAGVDVNGTDTTGGPTTATAIPFGELSSGVASTAAQRLTVSTNAANGFVVTAEVDGQLASGSADIDGFANGDYTSTPAPWSAPDGVVGSENTYGHWGMSSDDTTLTNGLSDLYTGGENYVSASTTPVEVFRHNGPINGIGVGQGTTTVIYKAEVTALQEASANYSATLTYIATPVF